MNILLDLLSVNCEILCIGQCIVYMNKDRRVPVIAITVIIECSVLQVSAVTRPTCAEL